MQFKRLIGGAGVALALAASVILPGSSAKAAAYGAAFQTSITYQNVGAAAATVEFQFFQEGSATGVPVSGGTLAPGASTSLLVSAQPRHLQQGLGCIVGQPAGSSHDRAVRPRHRQPPAVERLRRRRCQREAAGCNSA